MPSVNHRPPAELVGNAPCAVPVRRGIRHSSPVGINGKAVEPLAHLTDGITWIVNGHPYSQIDELLPWAYAEKSIKTVA